MFFFKSVVLNQRLKQNPVRNFRVQMTQERILWLIGDVCLACKHQAWLPIDLPANGISVIEWGLYPSLSRLPVKWVSACRDQDGFQVPLASAGFVLPVFLACAGQGAEQIGGE